MADPVTNFIQSTEALLTETAATIVTTGVTVQIFSGTSYDQLWDFIPELSLPAAVVIYQGSSFDNRPRRTARVAILLIASAAWKETGAVSVRAMLDGVMAKLDEHIKTRALWKIRSDEPVDLGENLEAILTQFDVEDN
jgi:hypothetical protein